MHTWIRSLCLILSPQRVPGIPLAHCPGGPPDPHSLQVPELPAAAERGHRAPLQKQHLASPEMATSCRSISVSHPMLSPYPEGSRTLRWQLLDAGDSDAPSQAGSSWNVEICLPSFLSGERHFTAGRKSCLSGSLLVTSFPSF